MCINNTTAKHLLADGLLDLDWLTLQADRSQSEYGLIGALGHAQEQKHKNYAEVPAA